MPILSVMGELLLYLREDIVFEGGLPYTNVGRIASKAGLAVSGFTKPDHYREVGGTSSI